MTPRGGFKKLRSENFGLNFCSPETERKSRADQVMDEGRKAGVEDVVT